MRPRIVLLFAFLLLRFSLMPNRLAVSHASEIRAVLAAQQASWNRGDIDGFMNGYARSSATVFVSGDTSLAAGRQCVIVTRRNMPSARRMGRLNFSDLEITCSARMPRWLWVAGSLICERTIIRTDDSP